MYSKLTRIFLGGICLTLLIVMVPGCPKPSIGHVVTGTVTFDGKPLEEGTIVFHDVKTNEPLGGMIKAGKYKVDVLPGEKKVKVSASKVVGSIPRDASNPNSEKIDKIEQYIPAQYNTKTTLTATVTQNGGSFNFDLKSSP